MIHVPFRFERVLVGGAAMLPRVWKGVMSGG
jgi:hypothetical protein